MGISNNSPTMSYIHASGISVVWNNETYMVQDFATNKKYIYWNADLPNQLNASNVMPNRSTKQYLVIVNDNGMHTLVPSTSDNFSISFDGNSNQAIKDRIFGLYEKNEQFGNKFVAIEQDINGIKQIVGDNGESSDGSLIDRVSKIEQRADGIDLSVEEISKKYNDDKETNKLREDLNSSIIKLNSTLGTFKSELTDYFKNNEVSSEEQVKIKTQLEILTNKKVILEGYVNTVRLIAESNNQTQDVIALDSAKKSLQIAHDNLHNNVTNAVIDSIIMPTENTIIIDSFAKYNLKINELKNTCDDIIILGVGGVITEELANISIKSNEIKLSVSKVESDLKNDMGFQKIELEDQIKDVTDSVGSLEDTMNGAFKDGILSESEKQSINQHLLTVSSEKTDIDKRYATLSSNTYLEGTAKTNLTTAYNNYIKAYNSLVNVINNILTKDGLIDSTDKDNLDNAFEEHNSKLGLYSTADLNALDYIASKKAESESAKVDKKYADIILDPENGIVSKVAHINQEINGVGGIAERMASAESKISEDAITNTVSKSFYTKEETENSITSKGYQTSSQVQQAVDNLEIKFQEGGGYNLFRNSSFKNDLAYWGISGTESDGSISILDSVGHFAFKDDNVNTIQIFMQNKSNKEFGIKQDVSLVSGKVYSIDFYANGLDCGWGSLILESNGRVEHVLHFNPLESEGGGFNKWMDVDFSFTATTENYTIKIVLKDGGNNGHMWIAKPNLVEGHRKVWTPNPNEVYGNVIRMDKEGLKINHSDNSKGIYDAKGITYYNSQGVKTSAIADGRFSTIDNDGNVIGYTGKSIWKGTDTHLTSLDACYGSTVGLGATISGNGDTTIPLVVASQGMLIGDTWMQQGLNIFSPRTFGKQTFFRKNIGIESVTMEHYADDLDYGVIVGSNGVNMGVIHDNQSSIGFCIEKNLTYYTKCIVQCHTDLNMNHFSILNANIQYPLIDTLSDDNNGVEIDEEKQVINMDLAKVIYRLNKENMALIKENEMLKQHQLEQDEILVENAFEIANMKLGVL